jgi:hypothetical protein
MQIAKYTYEFDLKAAGNGWEITIFPDDKSFGDFNRVSFDGTNLYALHDIETAVGKLKSTGAPVAKNLATGNALEQEVPHDASYDCAGQVWIAYASAAYFRKHTNGDLLEIPYYQMTGVPLNLDQSLKRTAFWTLGEDDLGLPRRVSYLGEHRDFTNAEYSVKDYQVFGKIKLPSSAVFDIYYDPVSISQTKDQQVLRIRYTISVDKVSDLKSVLSFPPSVPVMTMVLDSRFDNALDKIPTVLYWTDTNFLTKAEIQTLPADAKRSFNDPSGSPLNKVLKTDRVNRPLAKALLVAFVAINMLFLIKSLIGKYKNKTN